MNGLIQVYTGNGKGKTTAAAGLALRALGAGKKVLFLQFFKQTESGEVKKLRAFFPQCRVINFRQGHPAMQRFTPAREEQFRKKIAQDLERTRNLLKSGRYDIVILDEIIIGLRDRLFTTREILELCRTRPDSVELVLTGRGAPPCLTRTADLVTRMDAVKHPYEKKFPARKGIEY